MTSWYGLLLDHENRHHELLHEAERQRLANAFRSSRRQGMNLQALQLFLVAVAAILMVLLQAAWVRLASWVASWGQHYGAAART